MRKFVPGLLLGLLLAVSSPVFATTIVLTSGTSWTVPDDWNNSSNEIELLGAGGLAYYGAGGGGGFSKIINFSATPGATITYHIGSGSSTTQSDHDTWFDSTSTALAEGGGNVVNVGGGTGGGQINGNVGDVTHDGGYGSSFGFSCPGPGGGGAAGPTSDGSAGGNPTGGAAGTGSLSGYSPGAGGDGAAGGGPYYAGNDYGGGGGGACDTNASPGGSGIIVINYTPLSAGGNTPLLLLGVGD